MGKPLSEMTLEELWELFPILLAEHRPEWGEWYREESSRLAKALPAGKFRLSHIGSTAIEGIYAKPIVDILLEIPENIAMDGIGKIVQGCGYLCMSEEKERKSFNRGYTERGFAERVFHLHLRRFGDNDELYFRDYLNGHPEAAKAYEALKLSLWKRFEHNRDAYTQAKGGFVREYTARAKAEYGYRYGSAKEKGSLENPGRSSGEN